MTRDIAALEERIGRHLFLRAARMVRLTVNRAAVAIDVRRSPEGFARVRSYIVATEVGTGRLQSLQEADGERPFRIHVVYDEDREAAARRTGYPHVLPHNCAV